jgi:hypothetical protein
MTGDRLDANPREGGKYAMLRGSQIKHKSDDLTANTRVPVVPFGLACSVFLGEKV